MPRLDEVLKTRRVVICVGSGGVGKTTTSASLGVHAALTGRRVLCLTIDPARRLANSLGLKDLHADEQVVSKELFERHGLKCAGTLAVMMLNTQRTFEELVMKHASSEAARDRILRNRLYQHMARSLAGTGDYMAMEKLHAVRKDPRWDLIVLDTPPTSNALDFLEAPSRMIAAIDSPAVRWLAESFQSSGKVSFSLLSRGASFLFRGISAFTGTVFLEHVAEFVVDMNDLFGGFRARAEEVSNALRSPEVSFVVVTSPSPPAAAEAVSLGRRLENLGMTTDSLVVNAIHETLPETHATRAELAVALAKATGLAGHAADVLERMRGVYAEEQTRAHADRSQLERLRTQFRESTHLVEVPAFDEDIHDLSGLALMAQRLVHATDEAS